MKKKKYIQNPLKEAFQNGEVKMFTPKEMAQIQEELNEGMEEFQKDLKEKEARSWDEAGKRLIF